MSDYKIVIPARYGSSRLPGKPLISLCGKPMIQHVWERAGETGMQDIVIATDDQRIYDAAAAFGAEVVMTSAEHENGTERIAEVARMKGWDDDAVIVNLQGDEPLIPESLSVCSHNWILNSSLYLCVFLDRFVTGCCIIYTFTAPDLAGVYKKWST